MTVDRAHLLVEPRLAREDLYVGLTRARSGTRLYVATIADLGPDHRPDAAGGTAQVLRSIVNRAGVELSASDTLRAVLTEADSLRRMASEYEHALGVYVGDRYRVIAEAVHPGITTDHAWPNVAHRLHRAEAAGTSAGEALRHADALGSYTDAHSEAQVLCFRLDRLAGRDPRASVERAVPPWLAASPPVDADSRWDTYLAGRYGEMATRVSALVRDAVYQPWSRQVGWSVGRDEALRQVVAYRSVYAENGDDPLGQEPDRRTRQHEAWRAATDAVRRSHLDDSPAGSGAARLVEELSSRRVDDDAPRVDVQSGPARHV